MPWRAASSALSLFEGVEVLEEEEPGGLFCVVEFGGAAGFFPEDVVDVFEGLFEHVRELCRTRLKQSVYVEHWHVSYCIGRSGSPNASAAAWAFDLERCQFGG